MSKYKEKNVIEKLRRDGVRFGTDNNNHRIADASHLLTVGLSTLGKLDYMKSVCGYEIKMPAPAQGRGLVHP